MHEQVASVHCTVQLKRLIYPNEEPVETDKETLAVAHIVDQYYIF